MTNPSNEEVFASLDALLDRENAALINGEFEKLSEIVSMKGELLERLEAIRPNQDDGFTTLHGKVRKNQLLLDAALKGVRRVADRMATLRRVNNSLETYNQHGKRTFFDTQPPKSVEKRA